MEELAMDRALYLSMRDGSVAGVRILPKPKERIRKKMLRKRYGNAAPFFQALQKAQNWCQANLSGAELNAVGGLSACANAYLEGGASAVNNLLAGLTDTVGGLLGG